jgi:ribonuclease BN (tRNA processing enzyme)
MDITVLGCAGGDMPELHLPAFLVDGTLLLDAGTIATALGRARQRKVRDVLITHAHLDHIRALPFFADDIVIRGLGTRLRVHADARVLRILREHVFNGLVWPDFSRIPSPADAVLSFHELPHGSAVRVGSHQVTAFPVPHPTPACGYLVEDGKGRRLFYTGDTGPGGGAWKRLAGVAVHALIIEVSFSDQFDGRARLSGHLTPALLAGELAGMDPLPGRVFITHAKPAFREEIRGELARLGVRRFVLLKDGMKLKV